MIHVFYLGERENLVIVAIYVDDIIVVARRDCDTVGRLYAHLSEEFEVKDLGLTKYCLGIEFSQKEGKITMNQRGYVDDLLKRFGMVDSKPVATPMSQGTKLARNEKIDSTQVDVPYRLVSALMYLSVCTRPDITHAASYLSQFNNCYDSDHWTAAKRVLRYLKGTRDVDLIYGKTSDPLTGFVDADWANCEIDRKSYTGFAFILAGCPISWESKDGRLVFDGGRVYGHQRRRKRSHTPPAFSTRAGSQRPQQDHSVQRQLRCC